MDNKYRPIPFWSWNDELDEKKLTEQIEWMHFSGIGGFFMHARGGLTTPYLGEKWFSCVDACLKKAEELGMEAYAYDENGWPSGFAGGKLLVNEEDRDRFLMTAYGEYDPEAYVSYDVSGEKLVRVTSGSNVLNIYNKSAHGTADILNEKVVKKFIEYTHEEYKKRDVHGVLKGFFTDEPQYQRWYHPYTNCLEAYFKEHYGEDIKDRLGLMFVEKEGYRDFRYKYWKAMQDMMLNSYAKQVYTWCDENGYKATGHYIEEKSLAMQMMCCGGIMPFYEYEHIPGIDWLSRSVEGNDLSPKQVGSAAAQLGKKQILTESFACAGWDATPKELKHIFEWQAAIGGISLLCHHLLPYSEWGQRKRDYPEHYGNANPWAYENFRVFNDEISEIGEKLSKSSELVRVALLHPIRSAYLTYKREDPFGSVRELDANIGYWSTKLDSLHIPFHFIDETLLSKHAEVKGKNLKMGLCQYDIILLPKIYTMDKTTEKLLHEYVSNGGKILLLDEAPTYLEGEPYSYDYLKSNITLDDVIASKPFISKEDEGVRISYRKDDETNKRFFYIVNIGEERDISINGCSLHFLKWESRFIDEDKLKSDSINPKEIVTFGDKFKVVKPCANFLTLDKVSYSTDGSNYSEPLDVMGVFDLLLNKRYKGDLYLRYSFDVEKIPGTCSALIEDQHIKEVVVNGNKVESKGSVLEDKLLEFDIAKELKLGKNEVVVKIDYYQDATVYNVLFDQTETSESLLNCLVYPTTIEAIYLKGDFGVYGPFKQGKTPNVLLGEDFRIGEQKKEIASLIEDGFPFFRGQIELEQEFEVSNVETKLVVSGRYQLIDLFINDKHVKTMMFDEEIDISNFVKKGKNVVRLALIVSNRNLLGPFHSSEEESIAVGPYTFERRGSWVDGKLSDYRDSYSFVKTLL
ncbi:MAG: hypothetical protein MJ239_02150 [Bacilli bacterium]|nr:hypothetical protein [Bacilli bacterium]